MTVYQGTSFTPELTATGYALDRAGVRVSGQTCEDLAASLRRRHEKAGTRRRLLAPLAQAVLVIAFIRANQTYAELAAGFGISEATCWRNIREGISGPADRGRRFQWTETAIYLALALALTGTASGGSAAFPERPPTRNGLAAHLHWDKKPGLAPTCQVP